MGVLVERRKAAPAHGTFLTPSGASLRARLVALARRLNSMVSERGGRCERPSRAVALWRAQARAARVPSNTYILFTAGSAATPAGSCARVIVDGPGGGRYTVYVAPAGGRSDPS